MEVRTNMMKRGAEQITKTIPTSKNEAMNNEQIIQRFLDLVRATNKEKPRPTDVEELCKMLPEHRGLERWRSLSGIAQTAELTMLARAFIGRNG